MTWIVGDGQTIRIWQDPWLLDGSLRSYIAGPLLLHDEENRVHSLWINQSWAFDLLNFPLSPHLQNLIQGIPIAYLWPYNKGTCSVKSASHFLYDQSLVPWNTTLGNWLWTLPCPKKIQFFLWKAMRNRLPTRTFLAHGRQHVDSHCPRCNSPEMTLHILWDCPWAREVWSQSPGILPFSFYHMPLQDWLRYNATLDRTILPHQLLWQTYFPFTCWKLWLARNERIFKNHSRSQHSLLYSSVQAATEYHFLAGTTSQPPSRIPHLVKWYPPPISIPQTEHRWKCSRKP